MSLAKLMLATAVASLVLVAMPTNALAETSAEQEQKLEVECSAEGYGQAKCKAVGEQRQRIKGIRTRDGVAVYKVRDTAVDTKTAAAITGVVALGAIAAFATIKNRVA